MKVMLLFHEIKSEKVPRLVTGGDHREYAVRNWRGMFFMPLRWPVQSSMMQAPPRTSC